ncbi:hypothetical protein V6Z11_A11G127900 [Gossypium hirsutum]
MGFQHHSVPRPNLHISEVFGFSSATTQVQGQLRRTEGATWRAVVREARTKVRWSKGNLRVPEDCLTFGPIGLMDFGSWFI